MNSQRNLMIFSAAHCWLCCMHVMRLLFVLLLHLSAVDWWRPMWANVCHRLDTFWDTQRSHVVLWHTFFKTIFSALVAVVFKCSSTARCWRSVSFREACVAIGSRARSCVTWRCENSNGFPPVSSEQIRTADPLIHFRPQNSWVSVALRRGMKGFDHPTLHGPLALVTNCLHKPQTKFRGSMFLPPISFSFESYDLICLLKDLQTSGPASRQPTLAMGFDSCSWVELVLIHLSTPRSLGLRTIKEHSPPDCGNLQAGLASTVCLIGKFQQLHSKGRRWKEDGIPGSWK